MPGNFIPLNRSVILKKLYAAEKAALEAVASEIETKAKAKAPVRKLYKEKRRKGRVASADTIAAAIRFVKGNKRITERQRTEALYLLQRHPEEAKTAVSRRGSMNRRRAVVLGKNKNVSLRNKSGLFRGQIIATERVFKGKGSFSGLTVRNDTSRGRKAQRGFEPDEALSGQLSPRGRYELRSGRSFTNELGESIRPGDQPNKIIFGGRLKNSIIAGAVGRADGEIKKIQVSATAPYALYVEFPTRHNRAQPFLLPAMKEAKESLGRRLTYELQSRGLKRG